MTFMTFLIFEYPKEGVDVIRQNTVLLMVVAATISSIQLVSRKLAISLTQVCGCGVLGRGLLCVLGSGAGLSAGERTAEQNPALNVTLSTPV